ncbi:hypothetical protein KAU33_14235 [Candidatus Dependentiae bacterium]|nr:hypothetical protein [Candidatus Dependentiae bacterium]
MNLTTIIGVAIGLTLFTSMAATPINQYIFPKQYKIDVGIQKELIFTPEPVTDQIVISEYPEITKFFNELPPCTWMKTPMCGMRARYARLEAEKVGIKLGEIRIHQLKNQQGMDHQINYFFNDDKEIILIDYKEDDFDIMKYNEFPKYWKKCYHQNISEYKIKIDYKI